MSTSSAWRLMVFKKLIRYTGLAVGLKPSATGCEARLRGLDRPRRWPSHREPRRVRPRRGRSTGRWPGPARRATLLPP